jgi:hypothetical protein
MSNRVGKHLGVGISSSVHENLNTYGQTDHSALDLKA